MESACDSRSRLSKKQGAICMLLERGAIEITSCRRLVCTACTCEPPVLRMGGDQVRHRLPQQFCSTERHAELANLLRHDLILRPLVQIRDRAGAAGELFGDLCDFLLGDVSV